MHVYCSPAKVNLFLHIAGKRGDGYHEIATLMQAVDLCDTLTFEPAPSDRLECTHPALPLDGNNTILRAAALFRKKSGKTLSVAVKLEKRIPLGAGLGGGSSNGATTLWALNEMSGFPLTIEELSLLGQELGSDVPFFFSLGSAYCTGRGEKIQPVASLPQEEPLSLYFPPLFCSTPAVYKAVDPKKLLPRDLQRTLKSWLMPGSAGEKYNDLEEPALALYPSLKIEWERLKKGGYRTVRLSGSGSTLLCWGSGQGATHPVRYLRREESSWYSLS